MQFYEVTYFGKCVFFIIGYYVKKQCAGSKRYGT